MNKLTIADLDLDGRKLLLRVDFNVPIRDGRVDDDNRVVAALPTIRHALDHRAAVILMSHLGRPKGERKTEFGLRPVADCLEQHLGRPVGFVEDCVGTEAERAAAALGPGDVLLLENLRFHPGEEKPDSEPGFAAALAALGDRYVNDAFGTAHRAHASMVAVAERFERRAAGFLMARELEYFGRALSAPARPFVALLGGAKVGDKILLIESLLDRVDVLLIGGAMAYTFLAARGVEVGASRVEADRVELAGRLLARAKEKSVDLLLPVDHVCGREFAEHTEWRRTEGEAIPAGWLGLDVGPGTVARFAERIGAAGTVIWNGPLGVFEWEPFAAGTMALARACADSAAITIVGGGDSASAAKKSGLAERFSHISTGGGASLELLEGKTLPGVAVLGPLSRTMRKPLVAGNWKMNASLGEAVALATAVRDGAAGLTAVEIALCPPFTALARVGEVLRESDLALGAQHVHWEHDGAFTGEISTRMLADVGCRYTIVGHSERRTHFGETDAQVNRRARALLAAGLAPIVCVGETLEQRESGRTMEVVRAQVRGGLAGLAAELGRVVVAYEPVWAIGTGRSASAAAAQEVHAAIRGLLGEIGGTAAAEVVRILYGGSVTPATAAELFAEPDVDGGLVGGASLKADPFLAIVRAAG